MVYFVRLNLIRFENFILENGIEFLLHFFIFFLEYIYLHFLQRLARGDNGIMIDVVYSYL